MSDITVIINGAVADEIDKMLEHKIERVGQFVENKAKENMQGHNVSGILRASISHSTEASKGAWYKLNASKDGLDLTTPPTVENLECIIGTSVEYAVPFHEGHGSFSGVPFLRDAVYNHVAEIANLLKG